MRAEDRLDRGAPGGGAATQARRTVATFDLLELREAEAAVDRLSDRGFPVQRVDEAARLLAWPARQRRRQTIVVCVVSPGRWLA